MADQGKGAMFLIKSISPKFLMEIQLPTANGPKFLEKTLFPKANGFKFLREM
jgi:hypothetical protein